MKKRIISILLSLATIIGMTALGFTVSAETFTGGDYTYELLNDGTIEITNYNGHAKTLEIPSEIDGKAVTSIGYGTFGICSLLSSVTIPESVTFIDNNAFILCENLKSIALPSNITSISPSVFAFCESLEQIAIPNGVTEIGNSAFYGCKSLESIVIPDSVTTIGEGAFENCVNLKSVTLPSKLESIYSGSFSGCESLESVEIPSSVKSIGYYAFADCWRLSNITFADGSMLEKVASGAFDGTDIYNNEANWENGLLYIGNCLYSGVFQANNNEDFDTDIFAKGDITVKSGTKVIADGAFSFCRELTGVTLPDTITHIGNYAFYGCEKLIFADLASGVTSIGESAFYDCDWMKSIVIPDSVTEIGEYALGYTGDVPMHTIFFQIICSENSAAEKYAIENEMYYRTTAYDYGDANNDGSINMLDVLLIRKYIAKQPVTVDLVAADVTDDGVINMLDVLLIRKYIAKQPVMLGPQPKPPVVETPDIIETPDVIETPDIL
ncbi:MAG: leucine-rich repeat protein [Acutalibacteraceae bacterium]